MKKGAHKTENILEKGSELLQKRPVQTIKRTIAMSHCVCEDPVHQLLHPLYAACAHHGHPHPPQPLLLERVQVLEVAQRDAVFPVSVAPLDPVHAGGGTRVHVHHPAQGGAPALQLAVPLLVQAELDGV